MRSSAFAHPRGHHTHCALVEVTRCSLCCSLYLLLPPHRSGDAYPLPQAGRGREHEGSAQAVPPSIASLLVARPQLCKMARSTTASSLDTRTGTGIKPRAMPRDSWSRREVGWRGREGEEGRRRTPTPVRTPTHPLVLARTPSGHSSPQDRFKQLSHGTARSEVSHGHDDTR